MSSYNSCLHLYASSKLACTCRSVPTPNVGWLSTPVLSQIKRSLVIVKWYPPVPLVSWLCVLSSHIWERCVPLCTFSYFLSGQTKYRFVYPPKHKIDCVRIKYSSLHAAKYPPFAIKLWLSNIGCMNSYICDYCHWQARWACSPKKYSVLIVKWDKCQLEIVVHPKDHHSW